MKEFKSYHPIVSFIYFALVLVFACIFMHPVCLAISFGGAMLYSLFINGKKAALASAKYLLPLIIVSAILNPAFNHEGATVLAYLPSGNPLTAESVANGIAAAIMLAAAILWFSCYSAVMTSDKFIYLFGKIMPSLSLIFSMVLRLVPKFRQQLAETAAGQKCIGNDISRGSFIHKVKTGIKILSIMITRSLEEAIDTADSMKSRGYGLHGRTAYSNFILARRDIYALLAISLPGMYVILGAAAGCMRFSFYPTVEAAEITPFAVSVFAAYLILCLIPIIIELKEQWKWKSLKSKI